MGLAAKRGRTPDLATKTTLMPFNFGIRVWWSGLSADVAAIAPHAHPKHPRTMWRWLEWVCGTTWNGRVATAHSSLTNEKGLAHTFTPQTHSM